MAYGYIYTIFNIAEINVQTTHMLKSSVKIRHRIFFRNLITQLVSEQIKRHKPPQVCLSLYTWNFISFKHKLKEILTTTEIQLPRQTEKVCVMCYVPKTSCSSKYFGKCCGKYVCLEHSDTVCDDCHKHSQSQLLKILIN